MDSSEHGGNVVAAKFIDSLQSGGSANEQICDDGKNDGKVQLPNDGKAQLIGTDTVQPCGTDSIDRAAQVLKEGGIALFPTDTVAGIGVAVAVHDSPLVLAKIKGRAFDKPIAWLVASPAALDTYGVDVPEYAYRMAQGWWPGALTLIVKASEVVPAAFSSQEGTIGLRMPACVKTLELISKVGSPLATTSANISGELAPQSVANVSSEVSEKCAAIVSDDDAPQSGIASTVVDCTGDTPVVLREGAITSAEIEQLCVADQPIASVQPACQTADISFASADGTSTISARLWFSPTCLPDSGIRPKGIIHIAHGMAEYIRRYDDFARYLVGQGFVVCGSDMIGHGESATSKDDLGHIPLSAGRAALISDIHTLRGIVSAFYPEDTPYIAFGHSMGSFMMRAYIAEHGDGLAAAILSGTGNPAPVASVAGNIISRGIARVRGERYRSAFVDSIAIGAYNKKIANPRTSVDWLSVNNENVDTYVADEYCGQMFSVGGFSALTDLTRWVVSKECAALVPKDLPVLLIAGNEDPVGENAVGVHKAAELLRNAGVKRVDEEIFPHMRHEILNENDHMKVYTFVAQWMEEVL